MGRKQRRMLGLLMLFAGSTLPPDIIVDFLWTDKLPSNPNNSLQDLVKRLRTALGDQDRTTIVTRNGEYGLFVDPHCLDVELFRRLALAGLKLEKAEPGAAELLLARAIENAKGDLPDISPDFRASGMVDELYNLRDVAFQALVRLGQRNDPEYGLPEESFEPWSVQGRLAGLALRVAELGEIALADLVGSVSKLGGRIHQLSRGVMLASFSDGGSALRAAIDLVSDAHLAARAIDGGAVCHMEPTAGVGEPIQLMDLFAHARGGQIVVSDGVYRSAASLKLKGGLLPLNSEAWQFQFGRRQAERPDVVTGVRLSPASMRHRFGGRTDRMARPMEHVFADRRYASPR